MTKDFAVGVVGLGLIGGSILRSLHGNQVSVVGFDTDPQTRQKAETEGFKISDTLARVAANSKLVFVAVPPGVTAHVVRECLIASEDTFVVDTASVKEPIIDELSAVSNQAPARFLAAHPLAGSEEAGWSASSEDLLNGSSWAICPSSSHQELEPFLDLSRLLDVLDSRMIVCDAQAHDQTLARTSHAPHVLAEVIARSIDSGSGGGLGLGAALSGGSLRDMTRVADSDLALWQDILGENERNVRATLRDWSRQLSELSEASFAGPALEELWSEGQRARSAISRLRWQEPVWEESSIDCPGWEHFIKLGASGRAIRSVQRSDSLLTFEVAVK